MGANAAGSARWAVLPSVVCALATTAPAFADDDVDPYALSPEQLFSATVVSASRSEASLWEAPAALYVITSEDIARSGATSIPEALRLAPGVQVARVNTGGWAISVRGFNATLANKLLVLIDGREVYDPLFSGVYWDVQDTSLLDIDRIEVVRGPGATLWGANAVNGVINIITKRAADTQGALITATAGNVEAGGVTARYGGAVGNAHWRVYARAFERAGFDTMSGADGNNDWNALRGGFRVDAPGEGGDAFTVQGDIYRSDTGDVRTVYSLTAPYSANVAGDIEARGGNLLGRWTHARDGGGKLTTQIYADFTERDQLNIQDERTTFDLDMQYEAPVSGPHALVVGARYRNTVDKVHSTPITRASHLSNREELWSAFLQDQITLAPERLHLTLGSKFDYTEYTGLEIQPSVRLQWLDDGTQTAWASVSRAVRTPTALEREFTSTLVVFPPGPTPLLPVPILIELRPNTDFESEEVVAYEAGYRRQWTPDIAMDVAVFYNDYDKLATSSRLTPQFVTTPPLRVVQGVPLTNQTTAETQGLETVLTWRVSDTLHLSANYAYLDMELHGPPTAQAFNSEGAETMSPRNQASVRAEWDATDRLSLDGIVYYTDSLPVFQIAPRTRVDVRVGWRLTEEALVEVVGQGLFDDRWREFNAAGATTVEIPRSVYARLVWRG